MNKLIVIAFLFSTISLTSDKELKFTGFKDFLQDANALDLTKCFICQKHNPDTQIINRFKPDVHRKCYDPILEIEPAYAKAMNDILKSHTSNTYNYDAHRRALIRLALYKVSKVKSCDSFELYIKEYGKPKLEKIFFNGVISATGKKPFESIAEWGVQQMVPDQFIPQCNENINKKSEDFLSYVYSVLWK